MSSNVLEEVKFRKTNYKKMDFGPKCWRILAYMSANFEEGNLIQDLVYFNFKNFISFIKQHKAFLIKLHQVIYSLIKILQIFN